MNSLALQNTIEASHENRKSTFGSIDPVAVERALQITQRMEAAREAPRIAQPVDEEADVEA